MTIRTNPSALTVWVVDAHFPALTSAFILRRIQGLVARGFDVWVVVEKRNARVTPSAEQAALLPRVRYIEDAGRGLMALPATLPKVLLRRPWGTVRAWNPWRYRHLAGPRLIHAMSLCQDLPAPDVVLACFGPAGVLACALQELGLFSCPVITSFHGVDAYGRPAAHLARRYRVLRERGARFLPVSRHMVERLAEVGFDRRRLEVVHTPILGRQFTWRAPAAVMPGEPWRILGLGRLVEKKGFADSLRVVAALRGAGCPVRYDLFGYGDQEDALHRLASDLGLVDCVHFHGALPHAEVPEVLARSHLFLSTNRMAANGDCEGIPNTIKEAMAMGVPVVATRHAGTPELIVDGEHGLLADEGDIAGLTDACRRMMSDREFARRCSETARTQVMDYFDEEPLNHRLAEVLIEVTGRWSRRHLHLPVGQRQLSPG